MANHTIALKRKELVAEATWALYFEKPAGFTYEAGQYIAMVLPRLVAPDKRGPVRSLSMASAPFEEDLMFAVRISESGFKQTLALLEVGETVQITSRPVGHFTLSHAADSQPIVFLAGGVGITPTRSILKQAEHDDIDRVFTLFYSNRQEKDAAFDTEMEQLKLKHFTYITTLSQETTPCNEPNRERGYICEPMLEKYLARDTVKENWYYLVGAPAFIEAMEKALVSMGISKERFVIDPFTGLLSANQAGK